MAKRKHLFTVQELSDALIEYLRVNPELAGYRILMDGPDQYANWDGTISSTHPLTAVVLGHLVDLWERDE